MSRIQKDGGEEIIEDEAVKKGWSGNPDRRENPNSFVSQEKPTLSYVPIRIVVAITLCVVGLSLRNTYLANAAVVRRSFTDIQAGIEPSYYESIGVRNSS